MSWRRWGGGDPHEPKKAEESQPPKEKEVYVPKVKTNGGALFHLTRFGNIWVDVSAIEDIYFHIDKDVWTASIKYRGRKETQTYINDAARTMWEWFSKNTTGGRDGD